MSKIGILGGMSPRSTLEYYRLLISLSEKRGCGKRYPEIIIYSLNFEEFYDYLRESKEEKVKRILLR